MYNIDLLSQHAFEKDKIQLVSRHVRSSNSKRTAFSNCQLSAEQEQQAAQATGYNNTNTINNLQNIGTQSFGQNAHRVQCSISAKKM